MKIILSLSALLTVSVLGVGHSYDNNSLVITPEYTQYALGELVSLKSEMKLHPSGFVKYQGPAEEDFNWWCKGSNGKYEKVEFQTNAFRSEAIKRFERLPLKYNYGFGLPAYKIGSLDCRVQGKYLLVDREGNKTLFTIISNAVTIDVRPPNPTDELILKSMGIYENYMNGPPTMKTVQDVNDPESSYYCKPTIRDVRSDLGSYYGLENQYWSGIIMTWGTSQKSSQKWFSRVNDKLDNLEKSKCPEAAPTEIAYWRVLANLLNGDFKSAQSVAKDGLRNEPTPARKAFYERLVSLRNEDEFLRCFKSVRRKPSK